MLAEMNKKIDQITDKAESEIGRGDRGLAALS